MIVQAAHVLFSWIGSGFFGLLSDGSSSILVVACVFLIVFMIFLASFIVLIWPLSFKIQSLFHTFGIFFGVILRTIPPLVNLSVSFLRSGKI